MSEVHQRLTPREYARRMGLLTELLGGDTTAIRVAHALGRSGYTLPQHILDATHEELMDVRTVGPHGALRIGELRGSMRPGMRGRVDMTTPLLEDVYQLLQEKVRAGELISCAMHGGHGGMPPEVYATREHFGRRCTLVLTPTEVPHDSQTGCLGGEVCGHPLDCAYGCHHAADELTRLGQETDREESSGQ